MRYVLGVSIPYSLIDNGNDFLLLVNSKLFTVIVIIERFFFSKIITIL